MTSNHRSTLELVALQHRFAQSLDPETAEQVSLLLTDKGDAPAQVWSFSTPDVQADKVAAWIAADLAASGRRPSDYALLVRQKVGDIHGELRGAFEHHGLRVRNDDAEVGDSKVRLQELLADPVARLLMSLVRLASSMTGEPEAWHYAKREIENLVASEGESRLSSAADDTISTYVGELRKRPMAHADEFPKVSDPEDLAARLTDELTRLISVDRMRRISSIESGIRPLTDIARSDHASRSCEAWRAAHRKLTRLLNGIGPDTYSFGEFHQHAHQQA